MSVPKTPMKSRDTIFCEGNHKELYPIKYGRRRESAKIFREHKYDPHLRTAFDKVVLKVTKQRPEVVEARNLHKGDVHVERQTFKAKGELHVDILEHSTNVEPYGFKTSKKAWSPKDSMKYNQSVLSDVKARRPVDPEREGRIKRTLYSNAVKELLTLPESKYYKGVFPSGY